MKEFNYVSRISDNYHTSKDYSKLFEYIWDKHLNIICLISIYNKKTKNFDKKLTILDIIFSKSSFGQDFIVSIPNFYFKFEIEN